MGKTLDTIKYNINKIKSGSLKEMLRQMVWLYQYVRGHWLAIIFYTALGLVSTGISLVSSFISRDMVDIITGHQTGEVVKTFAMMIGFQLGSAVVGQLSGIVSSIISTRVNNEIRADIFEKILLTDWQSLSRYHTGDLLARWGGDTTSISTGILTWLPNLIINIVKFIAAFVIVMQNDWTFAVFSFITIPFSVLFSRRLMKRMVENNKKSAAMSAKLSGFNQETFANIQTIKAFDTIRVYVNHLKYLQKEFFALNMKYQKLSFWTSLLMTTLGLIVTYSSYGWGIYRVWSGVISYGTMVMFLSLSGTLSGALNTLVGMVPAAITLTTSVGRVMEVLELPREDYSHSEEATAFIDQNEKSGIGLKVDQVSYAYENENQVFFDASLSAMPHEIVALVGPSGEGKTTMMRLILALLNPSEGEVKLQGLDTDSEFPLSPSARKCFSYVPQGNTMFSGTIAENMRNVKEDATDEEIINALKMADAWEFVDKLEDGINSKIKERGGGFSEGQAQRLSIARALLRHSPILLLDEATSALDVGTEQRVIDNIVKDEYPRTCIVTTHRPSILTACNRVYAIREKKCEELSKEQVDELVMAGISQKQKERIMS